MQMLVQVRIPLIYNQKNNFLPFNTILLPYNSGKWKRRGCKVHDLHFLPKN